MANSNVPTKRNRGIRRVDPKADPKLRIYAGKNSDRVHVDIRLTAAEERGLYNFLRKRYGKN